VAKNLILARALNVCCIISDFDTAKTAVATDLMSDVTYLLSGSATILYLINKSERCIFYSGHPVVLLNLSKLLDFSQTQLEL
jgi:hypothetical protein